jgi:hypothetical protein
VREPEPAVGFGNRAADVAELQQVRDDLQREPALLLGNLDQAGEPIEIGASGLGDPAFVVAQQRPVRRTRRDRGQLNRPPDTCITSPVTKPASGEAR